MRQEQAKESEKDRKGRIHFINGYLGYGFLIAKPIYFLIAKIGWLVCLSRNKKPGAFLISLENLNEVTYSWLGVFLMFAFLAIGFFLAYWRQQFNI